MKRLFSHIMLVVGVAANMCIMLAVMYLFDFIFLKLRDVPIIMEVLDIAGELLDFSLTTLAYVIVALGGFSIVHSISQRICKSSKNKRYRVVMNIGTAFVIVAIIVFIVCFALNVGSIYTQVTEGTHGWSYIKALYISIKFTFDFTWQTHKLFFDVGYVCFVYWLSIDNFGRLNEDKFTVDF